jgi:hypothetical protein
MSEATPRTIYRVAPGPLRFFDGGSGGRVEFRPDVRQPFVVHFSDGACRGMRQEIQRVARPGKARVSWDAEGAGRRLPSSNRVNFHFPNYELVPAMQEASRQYVCNNSGRSLF